MSINPLVSKIALPYARALYEYGAQKNIIKYITNDFQNLKFFLEKKNDLLSYLKNPLVPQSQKHETLNKIFKSQLHVETLKFLNIVINRNRINILESIIQQYFEVIYNDALIITIEIQTAVPLYYLQKHQLIKKLKKITNSREVRLITIVDSTLIGGLSIKTQSQKIDFTIKNKLQQLSKHLECFIDI